VFVCERQIDRDGRAEGERECVCVHVYKYI